MQISATRRSIKIEVAGKGLCEGEFHRHKAPLTVGLLLRSLPLSGRAVRYKDEFVYFTTNLVAGLEKPSQTFKKGDIAFLPLNGSICIFLKDCQLNQRMTPLGQVTSGLEVIGSAAAGDVITILPAP
ncbi:MAG: hypothetical protein HA494_02475 [Thaumarchaeota archaeon]|nr:hypothetical protein [Nitrososphaerota archaeon]